MPANSADNSAILALPYIQPSQSQKHVTHNEAISTLDVLVQLSVAGFGATTPPIDPTPGDVHALGANPTDAWAGQDNTLATWRDGAWAFITPLAGWRAWGASEGELRIWDGTAWGLPVAGMDNLDGVGINTTADATNRLSISAPATLLSHEGAGHQLKINKAADTDTAALLFQSNWVGHAEMGLSGGTDFAIKVSDDGSLWTEALVLDGLSGAMTGKAASFTTITGSGDVNIDNGALFVDASSNEVGINTQTPLSQLEVNNPVGESGINITARLNGTAYGNSYVKLNGPRLSTADGSTQLGRGAITLLGNGVNNSATLWINANTSSLAPKTDDDATFKGRNAGLRLDTSGTLEFWDSNVAKFVIDNAGDAGIGTANPSFRLHVEESANDVVGYLNNTNATFSKDALRVRTTRAASSAYNFAAFQSADGADNEFLFTGDGNGKCDGSWTGGGADYAEYFEWADGNPKGEDRRGISVVLVGDQIREAKKGEDPIGVISGNPSVVGDAAAFRWKGKYLRDDFGSAVMEDYEAVSWIETITQTDDEGESIPRDVAHSYAIDALPAGITVPDDAARSTQTRRKLSPGYDPDYAYTPREKRAEWDTVGLMGKLRIRKGQVIGAGWVRMRDISDLVEEWLVR